MKKIVLYVALISYISISSMCAMSHDQREKTCQSIFENLKVSLQYFEFGSIQAFLSGLDAADSDDCKFWKKHREIALEYAAVAVMTARTSHEEFIKKHAPISHTLASAEKLLYGKSFERSVHANLNQKAILKYDLLHNKSDY